MNAREIKAFLALRGLKVNEIALAIGENRANVSQVINYLRATSRIRKKLKKRYGIRFDNSIKVGARSEHRAA